MAFTPTVNGSIPQAGEKVSASPIRGNFVAVINDLNTLAGLIALTQSASAITGGTISGVTIDGSVIGAVAPAAGFFTTLHTSGNFTVALPGLLTADAVALGQNAASGMGGHIDNIIIGNDSPAAATFTNLAANGSIQLEATGMGNYLDNIIIGQTTPQVGYFTGLNASAQISLHGTGASTMDGVSIGQATPEDGTFTTVAAGTSVTTPSLVITTNSAAGSFFASPSGATGRPSFRGIVGADLATALASPPAIGGVAAAAGTFTTLSLTGTQTANTFWGGPGSGAAAAPSWRSLVAADITTALTAALLVPPPIGGTTPAAGFFTTLQAGSNLTAKAGITLTGTFANSPAYSTLLSMTTGVNGQTYNGLLQYDTSGVLTYTTNGATGADTFHLVNQNTNGFSSIAFYSPDPYYTGNQTYPQHGSIGFGGSGSGREFFINAAYYDGTNNLQVPPPTQSFFFTGADENDGGLWGTINLTAGSQAATTSVTTVAVGALVWAKFAVPTGTTVTASDGAGNITLSNPANNNETSWPVVFVTPASVINATTRWMRAWSPDSPNGIAPPGSIQMFGWNSAPVFTLVRLTGYGNGNGNIGLGISQPSSGTAVDVNSRMMVSDIASSFTTRASVAATGTLVIGQEAATALPHVRLFKNTYGSFNLIFGGTTSAKTLKIVDVDNNTVVATFLGNGSGFSNFNTIQFSGTGNATITSGTGVPSSTQPASSVFLRTDGAVGTHIYVSAGGGTWNAIPGV